MRAVRLIASIGTRVASDASVVKLMTFPSMGQAVWVDRGLSELASDADCAASVFVAVDRFTAQRGLTPVG
jgi:hypothetical protein